MVHQQKKNLATPIPDLEERTLAVLTGSEIDFARLVTLGDAE